MRIAAAPGGFHSMQKKTIVTTSWDDGDRSDLKVAELLHSRKLSGTFYVPITPYRGQPALSHAELRSLSTDGFEIGAHGFSHKLLWGLPAAELAREIGPCKPILEDILGTEVRMFCYPRGRYDSNVVRALKRAGYCGARTVRMLATGWEFKPFEIPTTLQIFPHPKSNYIRNIVRARKVESLQAYLANRTLLDNWLELGKRVFDSVLQNGGIWHLWGHSWEIDELGLWEDLGKILDYVCKREGVTYLPNGELLGLLAPTGKIPENEKTL
jgi:peptidoglycan/xylan/chitin deacetylase (PgdA/CDA1 family)